MKMIAAVLIGAFAWQEPLWVLALTAVCLLLYDGSRGRSRCRSFFYIYYPAHLLVLYFCHRKLRPMTKKLRGMTFNYGNF